jgi:hypothetical protein
MNDLLSTYGLDFDTFNATLQVANAIPAGSAVLAAYMRDRVSYIPGDLDIWVQSNSDIGPLHDYLIQVGYTPDTVNYKSQYNSDVILSIPGADIYSVTNYVAVATTTTIQIITVECPAVEYVTKCTDLSITRTYWDPHTAQIVPGDTTYCDRMEFYVINHYRDIYSGIRSTDYARRKLCSRIDKYVERGFTFVECPIMEAVAADDRAAVAADAADTEVFDLLICDWRPLSEYAADHTNIFVRLGGQLHVVNRIGLWKYIKATGKSYWSHRCHPGYADMLLYSDYSVYEFDGVMPHPQPLCSVA